MKLQKSFYIALKKLPLFFEKNELAYLSLTSKPELHLRDNLAFGLQKRLLGKYLVGREWRRYDLAVLSTDSSYPKALCELKVYYTFDTKVKNKLARIEFSSRKDIKKLKFFKKCSHRYFLLFLIHPETKIPNQFKEVVGWSNRINRAIENAGGSMEVKKSTKKSVSLLFQKLNFPIVMSGEYSGGEYCGIKTLLLYWLVKI